jgi:sugar O-acyltransferase (sialic acid O-acetyltransferase NeuD family)
MINQAVVIGYSGHAYVVIDVLTAMGYQVNGYYEREEKKHNPYGLQYLGKETVPNIHEQLTHTAYFVSIGDNHLRKNIYEGLAGLTGKAVNAIHPQSIISPMATLAQEAGILVAPNAVANACSHIGKGTICNTSSVIEHDCNVGEFCHIAPGATLCGNVQVGNLSFIGANAVVKQGVKIGVNVTIGAGAVILKDVPDNTVVVGSPERMRWQKR